MVRSLTLLLQLVDVLRIDKTASQVPGLNGAEIIGAAGLVFFLQNGLLHEEVVLVLVCEVHQVVLVVTHDVG